MVAGWEALNERQTGLLMEQRRDIELAEAGMDYILHLRCTFDFAHDGVGRVFSFFFFFF